MSRCVRCNIDVKDESVKCPLCMGVLKQDENVIKLYPDISDKLGKMRFVNRLIVFLAIVAEAICILVNYLTYKNVKWSIITAVGLIYVCFTMLYSVKRNKSHQRKMIMQCIIAIFMIIAIDASLGFSGWSFKIAVPIAILAMDAGIIVLMIFGRSEWQNYIMAQIWMLIICIVSVLVTLKLLKVFPLMSIISVAVTVLCIAVTFVVGDKTAESEFRRRFHI